MTESEAPGSFQEWDVLVEVGKGGSPAYRKQALEARSSDWIVTDPPAPMTLLIIKLLTAAAVFVHAPITLSPIPSALLNPFIAPSNPVAAQVEFVANENMKLTYASFHDTIRRVSPVMSCRAVCNKSCSDQNEHSATAAITRTTLGTLSEL